MYQYLLFAFAFVVSTSTVPQERRTPIVKGKKIKHSSDVALAQETNRQEAETLFNQTLDKSSKEKSIISLIERGIEYFNNNPIAQAYNAFTFDKKFMEGEVYLFVLDQDGTFTAHGEQPSILWQNRLNAKDDLGYPYVQAMIATAKQGGGWVTYSWRNAIKRSYVKMIKKDDTSYIIGAGYYPQSKEDLVVNLVKGACSYFDQVVSQGYQPIEAFSTFNYPKENRFIVGDLYLYAMDFKGALVAQGDRPGLVGSLRSQLNYKDSEGTYVNREIIKRLEKNPEGIWIEYASKRTKKRAYAQKVTDRQGTEYFIACGFYPDTNAKSAEDLVGKAFQFMEAQGKSETVRAVNSRRDDTFRLGDLFVVIYDTKGTIIAHGGNEELTGDNAYNDVDESGRYYVRELIKKAENGGGWVDYKTKNSFQSTYVEIVNIGIDKFIITCGVFAISKQDTMTLLLKSGISYFETNDLGVALRAFVAPDSKFIRGDLHLFVLDLDGVCYAWGDDYDLIWKNLLERKDDTGVLFIKNMLDAVKFGSAKVGYTLRGRKAVASVELVKKNGKQYVIGSSFYY